MHVSGPMSLGDTEKTFDISCCGAAAEQTQLYTLKQWNKGIQLRGVDAELISHHLKGAQL